MRKNFILIIAGILFINCATFFTLSEEMLPLSKRLFSENSYIREMAIKEFTQLSQEEKQKVFLEIVNMFKNENDKDRQKRIIAALKELKAGGYIIIPLLEIIKQKTNIYSFDDITELLNSIEPEAEEVVFKLKELLKDKRWEVREIALLLVRKIAKKSEIVIPEIIKTMQEFGEEPEKFKEIFNTLSMINPEIAITQLLIDLKNKNEKIRKNSIEKLLELQANLEPKLPIKKEIISGLIRVLFSEDSVILQIVKEAFDKIEDKELKKEYEKYLEISKKVAAGFSKVAGNMLNEIFASQEKNLKEKMKNFYESIGRKEVIGDLLKNY